MASSEERFELFKHILRSKRYLLSSLGVIFFIAGLVALIKSFTLPITSSSNHKDVSVISMAHQYVHHYQMKEDVTDDTLQYLQKQELKQIQSHMKSNRRYLLNYTECLKEKFSNFENIVSLKKMKFPLSFNEMMLRFHKECGSEILDEVEICNLRQQKTIGRFFIRKEPLEAIALRDELPNVRLGGIWSPLDCTPKAKVAIIIPFRRREKHLPVLLRHLHPLLQRQSLLYRVFVIEQVDEYPFNRGKLMNVGFKEASNMFDFNCFVFHDVDLIPEDDRNDYGCPTSPRHMSAAIDKFNYNLPYPGIFGGVELFTKEHYELINGFRNSYWGWGAEDDDLYKRIIKVGLKLTRPSFTVGRYTMLRHKAAEIPPDRIDKLERAESAISSDGLLSMHYRVLSIEERSLYTLIRTDLRMEDDMLY